MFTTLGAYLHRIDPFVFRLTEDIGVRWYGLSYVAGFLAAYLLIRWLTQQGRTQLQTTSNVTDFVFATAIGTIIGGRLGYCIFYEPALLTTFTGDFPFWGVLMMHKGGMASHGGLLGIVAGSVIYAKRHGHSSLHLIDLCALASGIGIFFGRIANFVNGELIGRPMQRDLSWAVKFPQDIYDWPSDSPEKLVELTPIIDRMGFEHAGVTATQWTDALAGQAIMRGESINAVLHQIVLMTQEKGETANAVADMLAPLLIARHPSQLYAALLEGALVFCTLFFIWARPRKPGVIGAWFLMGYGVVRVFDEMFRMPDAHIQDMEFALLGITRGQLLSFVMIAAGVVYLINAMRRKVPKLGGWRGSLTA